MNSQSCSTPSLSLFPRELGGLLGDTEITAFDFATSASNAYLAVGGTSSSGDVVAHAGSAFITFEDALDYQMLWAKEYYLGAYAG